MYTWFKEQRLLAYEQMDPVLVQSESADENSEGGSKIESKKKIILDTIHALKTSAKTENDKTRFSDIEKRFTTEFDEAMQDGREKLQQVLKKWHIAAENQQKSNFAEVRTNILNSETKTLLTFEEHLQKAANETFENSVNIRTVLVQKDTGDILLFGSYNSSVSKTEIQNKLAQSIRISQAAFNIVWPAKWDVISSQKIDVSGMIEEEEK